MTTLKYHSEAIYNLNNCWMKHLGQYFYPKYSLLKGLNRMTAIFLEVNCWKLMTLGVTENTSKKSKIAWEDCMDHKLDQGMHCKNLKRIIKKTSKDPNYFIISYVWLCKT